MRQHHLILGAAVFVGAASTLSGSQTPTVAVPATVELPKPTGPHSIGTTTFRLIDESRTDTLADTPEPRQVIVHAWYPAVNAASGERAPYLRDGPMEARTFATLLKQPDGALDYLGETRTHA